MQVTPLGDGLAENSMGLSPHERDVNRYYDHYTQSTYPVSYTHLTLPTTPYV